MTARAIAVLVCAGLPAALVSAQTITVTMSREDIEDFGGLQRVANLPGPDGQVTLREAITAANNTPGAQTIVFAIPRAEWDTTLYSDRVLIRQEYMAYVSGDDTTIDFSTQTAFTGDTNPNGNEVALYYAGPPSGIPNLWLAGNRCVVRGVDRLLGNNFSNGLWITGNNARVLGCTTTGMTIRGDYGGGSGNVIGGTGPGEGNLFTDGVNILSHASNNIFIGNTSRWGVRINGDTFWGTCDNNRIGGATAAERNVLTGHGYTAEEGLPTGAELEVYHARNTVIEGNYIGTGDDGRTLYAGRTGVVGVGVDLGAVGTIVRNNVIGGIARTGGGHYQGQRFGIGVSVGATATATLISGNLIGIGADGVTPLLNVGGVFVSSNPNGIPSNTIIESNRIAHNETVGVRIAGASVGIRVTRNAILDNGALGIDLGNAGVTPNDATDADVGSNGLQNFPVLTSAHATPAGCRIVGTLISLASQSFIIEFFANPACDPSGSGEGATFVGSAQVSTSPAGTAPFDTTVLSAPVGWVVTATATQVASGNTSEFAACTPVQAPPCPADFNGDGTLDFFDYDDFVTCFEGAACPPGMSADFNADGSVDFFDYDDFVSAFESGC